MQDTMEFMELIASLKGSNTLSSAKKLICRWRTTDICFFFCQTKLTLLNQREHSDAKSQEKIVNKNW